MWCHFHTKDRSDSLERRRINCQLFQWKLIKLSSKFCCKSCFWRCFGVIFGCLAKSICRIWRKYHIWRKIRRDKKKEKHLWLERSILWKVVLTHLQCYRIILGQKCWKKVLLYGLFSKEKETKYGLKSKDFFGNTYFGQKPKNIQSLNVLLGLYDV